MKAINKNSTLRLDLNSIINHYHIIIICTMIRRNLSEICDEINKEPKFSKSVHNILELVIPTLHICDPLYICTYVR